MTSPSLATLRTAHHPAADLQTPDPSVLPHPALIPSIATHPNSPWREAARAGGEEPGLPGLRPFPADPAEAVPGLPDPDEARRLADLVNDALIEQARRHGVDLS